MMLVALGFSAAFLMYGRDRFGLFWFAAGAISAVATILTFSRGAFVGLVAILACWLIASRSTKLRLASIAAGAVAVAGVYAGLAGAIGLSPYVARVTALTSLTNQSTAERNVLWAMGLRVFSTHWLFGLGIGNFDLPQFWYPLAYTYSEPRGFFAFPQAVHSFYIGWASDAGLLGLIPLMWAITAAGVGLLRISRSRISNQTTMLAQGLLGGFAGYFVYAASSPDQNSQLPYILLALAGSLIWIYSGSQERDRLASPMRRFYWRRQGQRSS